MFTFAPECPLTLLQSQMPHPNLSALFTPTGLFHLWKPHILGGMEVPKDS